jgi:hypothetical protein
MLTVKISNSSLDYRFVCCEASLFFFFAKAGKTFPEELMCPLRVVLQYLYTANNSVSATLMFTLHLWRKLMQSHVSTQIYNFMDGLCSSSGVLNNKKTQRLGNCI